MSLTSVEHNNITLFLILVNYYYLGIILQDFLVFRLP